MLNTTDTVSKNAQYIASIGAWIESLRHSHTLTAEEESHHYILINVFFFAFHLWAVKEVLMYNINRGEKRKVLNK